MALSMCFDVKKIQQKQIFLKPIQIDLF